MRLSHVYAGHRQNCWESQTAASLSLENYYTHSFFQSIDIFFLFPYRQMSRRRRARDVGGFNAAGSAIPGVTTTTSDKVSGTYPLPGFNYPAGNGLPRQVPASLQGKRANMSSQEALARSMGLSFPAGKRPKGNPSFPPPPTPAGPTRSFPGRGTTPSFLVDAAMAAQQAIAQWNPGKRTGDFSSTTRLVQASKGELEFALYLKGQVVFQHKDGFLTDEANQFLQPIAARLSGRYIPTGIGTRRRHRGSYRLLSLPALNYYLRLADTPRNGKWLTPAQVLEQYPFDGVIRTDAHESEHPAYRKTNAKVYAVTIDGRQPDATNIWGAIRSQQDLYILVKRLPLSKCPSYYITSPADETQHTIPTHAGGNPLDYHPNPLQLIPWANYEKGHPTADDLRYFDEILGDYCYAKAVRIGWANYPSIASNDDSVNQAWYNARMLMDLPTIDLTLNHRAAVC